MKSVMRLLIVGTLLSGFAAAYATTSQRLDRPPVLSRMVIR